MLALLLPQRAQAGAAARGELGEAGRGVAGLRTRRMSAVAHANRLNCAQKYICHDGRSSNRKLRDIYWH